MTEVHVIVPEGIDDPERASGGNTYDRRVCAGLAASMVSAPAGAASFDFAQAALDAAPRGAGLAHTRRRRPVVNAVPGGTGWWR